MRIRANPRHALLAVVAILALPMLGYVESAVATVTPPGVSLVAHCGADGSPPTGTIDGVGMQPGVALNSAVLFGSTVVAQDRTGKHAASDGTYQSEQLTLERGAGFTVEITSASTGDPVATTTANLECIPPPSDTSTSTRNCIARTVTGTVTGAWLGDDQSWDLEYNSVSVSRNFSGVNGRPTAFPFTLQGVAASTSELDMKLVDTSPSPRFTSIPATVLLSHCTASASLPASHPSTEAARPSSTSSTSPAGRASNTSSHAASVNPVASLTPAGTDPVVVISSSPAPVSTPAAVVSHRSSSHAWLVTGLLIVLVVAGFGGAVVLWMRRRPVG